MEWLKVIGISLSMIALGYLALRVIGKRNFGEMSVFNIFLVLMLANVLSEPIKTDNFAELIIPTSIIIGVFFLYSYIKTTNKFNKGGKRNPLVLVRHGNMDEKALKQAKMTISEMLAELRLKGYSRVGDVEFAILEENGKISVMPKASKRAVTTSDLSVVTGYEGIPVPLVIDGEVQYDTLAKIKISPEQLFQRLAMMGYTEEMIKVISLAVLDEKNNIIIDENNDTNQGNFDQYQQSFIKKVQEDLKAGKKAPEDNDLGGVDDYIKP